MIFRNLAKNRNKNNKIYGQPRPTRSNFRKKTGRISEKRGTLPRYRLPPVGPGAGVPRTAPQEETMTAPVSRRQIVTAPTCVFDHPEFDGHEQIVFGRDEASGLATVIAVHSTTLGPALGGCRMWAYPNPAEALTDALRLSRGMTYKNALAGLDLGGGKAVILADPRQGQDTGPSVGLRRQVARLGGTYITAEDVGISDADMEVVATRTTHVRGIRATGLGDPSPYTALGVFQGIRAALAHRFGSDDPAGRTVTVQGLGHVGMDVARRLHEAGRETRRRRHPSARRRTCRCRIRRPQRRRRSRPCGGRRRVRALRAWRGSQRRDDTRARRSHRRRRGQQPACRGAA